MGADEPDLLESFAANVKRLRPRRRDSKGKPFTQKMLADDLGVTERYVQRVEQGTVNVGLLTVERFADALEVSPAQLLRRARLPERKAGRPSASRGQTTKRKVAGRSK